MKLSLYNWRLQALVFVGFLTTWCVLEWQLGGVAGDTGSFWSRLKGIS